MPYQQAKEILQRSIEELAVSGPTGEDQRFVDLTMALLHLTEALGQDLAAIKAHLHSLTSEPRAGSSIVPGASASSEHTLKDGQTVTNDLRTGRHRRPGSSP